MCKTNGPKPNSELKNNSKSIYFLKMCEVCPCKRGKGYGKGQVGFVCSLEKAELTCSSCGVWSILV